MLLAEKPDAVKNLAGSRPRSLEALAQLRVLQLELLDAFRCDLGAATGSFHRLHAGFRLESAAAEARKLVAEMARMLRAAGEEVLPLLLLDPPNDVSQPGYWQISEDEFVAKMQARHAKGTTAGPAEDPAYMRAVLRTTAAFEQASAKHRPKPYDGPV